MVNQIMPGVQNPLLAIAAKIREQISQQAMTPPQTSPPSAGAPEERDYTEGMERPELTAIKSEKEFKATPSRTTAFLVALGNILQDRQNLEAAKQQQAQNEYNAKLSDAMELNKLFKTNKMKREFDESDPDTQLRRELLQTELAQKKAMGPLEQQYKQAALDRLLMKGQGGGGRSSGGGESTSAEPNFANLSDEEVSQMTKWDASRMKVWKAANSKQKLLRLKPYMNEETTAKLYSGGGKWIEKDGQMVYEKGQKDLSLRDIDTALKIINKKIGNIEYENDVITPELQAELNQLKNNRKKLEDAMLNTVVEKAAPTQGGQPSTKKSLKDRAAELKAQNKTREEAEAILTQEGY